MPQYNFSAVGYGIWMLWKLTMHTKFNQKLITKFNFHVQFSTIHQADIKNYSIPLFRLMILTVSFLITPPSRQLELGKPEFQAVWGVTGYCQKMCCSRKQFSRWLESDHPHPTGHPHTFLTLWGRDHVPSPLNWGGPVTTIEVVLCDFVADPLGSPFLDPALILSGNPCRMDRLQVRCSSWQSQCQLPGTWMRTLSRWLQSQPLCLKLHEKHWMKAT